MAKIRHPLSGTIYDVAEDDTVVVEKDGRSGRFDRDGTWLGGEVRTADPEMCRWVASPRLVTRHRAVVEES